MAHDVHFQVSWESAGNAEEIRSAVAWFLPGFIERDLREEAQFVADLMGGKCLFKGCKGDLCLWGTVGNHLNLETFIENVTPVFRELWKKELILDCWNVVFACEQEASETVDVFVLKVARNLGTKHPFRKFDRGQEPTLALSRHSSKGEWYWNQL